MGDSVMACEGDTLEESPLKTLLWYPKVSLEDKNVIFFSRPRKDKELRPDVKVQPSLAFTCEWIVISLVWISWVRFNNVQKASAGSISLLQPAELYACLCSAARKSASASLERAFPWPGIFAFSLWLSPLYITLHLGRCDRGKYKKSLHFSFSGSVTFHRSDASQNPL